MQEFAIKFLRWCMTKISSPKLQVLRGTEYGNADSTEKAHNTGHQRILVLLC